MIKLRTIFGILLFLVTLYVLQSPAVAKDGPNFATLDRLQVIYLAEVNAQARYLAFALKADDEGYKQVASLFRAVARSEQILYTYHFDAIKELGGVPEEAADVPPVVASTKENLEKSSIAAEAEKLDSEYATYVKAARAEGNKSVAKVLEYARIVEAQNVRLFADAARGLEHMRGGPKGYFICGVSGLVSTTLDQGNCSGPDWERVR